MRLQADRLARATDEAGLTPEQLASAVERTGLEGPRSLRAVENWLSGRDHPRCKASDIAKLAQACGVATKDLCRFTSQVMHHRGSSRKARLLADLIRGRAVDEALNLLTFTTKRAAVNMKKALNAAIADAEQAEADVTALHVVESRVDEGPVIKRFRPKDRGRAHPILKRTSHITIGIEERQAGAR